jgi:uncharacterized surface protein with fasciclin (FAS1) repeats
MNLYKKLRLVFSVTLISIAIYSCSDKFEDHVAVTDPIVNDNLFQQLSKNSSVSEFNKLLVQTGLDKVIASSKTYTVFAPVNTAIAAIDPTILSDTTKLKNFVRNHIAVSAFRTDMASNSLTIKMLNGKSIVLLQSKIDEVNITTPDKFASNGIYHIIENAILPKLSIWEYLQANTSTNAQANFIVSLDALSIYPGAQPDTKNPVLDNEFIRETYNIRNEEGKYTLFLMQNTSFNAEVAKLIPYLNRASVDTTRYLATEYTIRDLVFEGELKATTLPDTLLSKFGVKVAINKANIVQTIKASNGLIHIMSSVDVKLQNRLVPTRIEGENALFFRPSRRANTFYRQKLDNNGIEFKDLMVQNHQVSLYEIGYVSPILLSTKYQVFWRAINDIQTVVFQQRLRVGSANTPIAFYPYKDVLIRDYNEIFIGEFTLTTSGIVPLDLIGANNNGTTGTNTLSLDYIKLVPIIK